MFWWGTKQASDRKAALKSLSAPKIRQIPLKEVNIKSRRKSAKWLLTLASALLLEIGKPALVAFRLFPLNMCTEKFAVSSGSPVLSFDNICTHLWPRSCVSNWWTVTGTRKTTSPSPFLCSIPRSGPPAQHHLLGISTLWTRSPPTLLSTSALKNSTSLLLLRD